MPIIKDVLLSSITVSSQHQDGWQKAIPYPTGSPQAATPFVVDPQSAYPKAGYATSDNYGGTGVTSMRGKLLWNASDKLSMTFTGDWSHENQTALPYTVLGVYQGNLLASTFSTLYNTCISNNAASLPGAISAASFGVFAVGSPTNALFGGTCSQPRARVPGISIGGAPLLGAGYVGGPPGPFNAANVAAGLPYLGSNSPRLYFNPAASLTGNPDTTYATGRPDFARNDVFGLSATGVYDINDSLKLKSITGYRQIKWNIGTQLDGTPETLQEVTDAQHQWQVSQEFQLLGKALSDRLNYVGGLYYFKEAGYVHDYVPFESLLYVYDVSNDVQNTNYAAFVHADYKLDRPLGPHGGRALSRRCKPSSSADRATSTPFRSVPSWVRSITGQPYTRYFPATPDSQAWHIFDPTATIEYHFNDNVMAYTSWGKGFKAGGWTTRLSAVIPSPDAARYGPEYSKTWEAGLKSAWFDRRLIVNTDVYYTDYSAIQLNVQQGISPVYINAGDAKIKGAELEIQSAVGGGLQLNGSFSYMDAYYTRVNANINFPQYALPDGTTVCPAGPPICGVQWAGKSALDAKLPRTPKWKMILDPSYTLSLPNDAAIRLVPVFTYTSEMFNDSLNTPELRQPATRMLDASIHYLSSSGLYDLALGGTNLTDERYVTAGSPNYGAGEVGGYYNAPRMWYLNLMVKMGGGQ